jgi:CHAT domain-containing protein
VLSRDRGAGGQLERALAAAAPAAGGGTHRRRRSGTAHLRDVQAALPADTLLLEYYEARGTLCVCLISRSGFDLVDLGPVARARDEARFLQFQLSKHRLGPDYLRHFESTWLEATQAHLHALYRRLLAPLGARLAGRRLVVVPHDFLHYVPFHALFDGRVALIDRTTVAYAPSASVHHLCATTRPPRGGGALMLGVPDRNAPLIGDELAALAAILPRPRVYRGRRASAARLRAEGPSSRIVHIAAHATFRPDYPMLSAVQLGDGPLGLGDLYDLGLRAELVTLSGCGTGLNALVGGDELLGLVRGYLSSGARSVLVSLWDAHDAATTDFMRRFYTAMMAGTDKAAAVRLAMVGVREQYPHPYYWAPFVLVGAA